jgi:hypothetical protein
MAAFAEPCACPQCGEHAPLAGVGSPDKTSALPSAGRHSVGCGCCSPRLRQGLKAEAVSAAAPRHATPPASGSFLTRA